jgi:hypothetical protein
VASFDGSAIFGGAVKMRTATLKRATQRAKSPGTQGVESTDLGLEGRYTTVEGRLFGDTPGDLASAKILFDSYNDGRAYTLVDTAGTTWPFVTLEEFEPELGMSSDPFYGYSVRYRAMFFHLV